MRTLDDLEMIIQANLPEKFSKSKKKGKR